MTALKTFMFDFDFDDDQLIKQMVNEEINEKNEVHEAPLPEPEIIPPTFSEAELNVARQEGFDAGKEIGITETMAELENTISQALSSIVNEILVLSDQQNEFNQQMKVETIELLNKLIGKMFPVINERLDVDETIQFSRSILPELLTEPRITLRVPEGVDQKIKSRIEPILKEKGYGGELIIIGEAEITLGACKVEWSSGSAERSSELLLSEIEKRLSDAINSELLTKRHNNKGSSAEVSQNDSESINDQEVENGKEQNYEITQTKYSQNENLSINEQNIDTNAEVSNVNSSAKISDENSFEKNSEAALDHKDVTAEQEANKRNENNE